MPTALPEPVPIGAPPPTTLEARLAELTRRKREIVDLLLEGERVPDIARLLHLSQSTVRNHLASAFRELGCHSQAQMLGQLRPLAEAARRVRDQVARKALEAVVSGFDRYTATGDPAELTTAVEYARAVLTEPVEAAA